MENLHNCAMCRRGLYRGRYQQHVLTENLPRMRPELAAYIQENAVLEVVFDNTRCVCHRCWQRADNAVRPPAVPEVQANDTGGQNANELYVPEFKRASNTPAHCIFNICDNDTRPRIPEAIKIHILCEYKLYIPDGARVCQEHLAGNNWDELPDFCNTTNYFSAAHFSDVCDILRAAVQRGSRLNFRVRGSMSNDEMHFWVGLNGDQFDAILEQTPSFSQRCNDPRTVLGIYLSKLRTGDSDESLAILFNMSRRTLERHLAIARECLMNEYVPLHLGMDHIDRRTVLERNLFIPKKLYGNDENTKVIIICDGTYIYINRSGNFLFQRQSYSLHKFSNLLKPFLIVCSDGYIIDVIGPYATKTDAQIMLDIMRNEEHPLHILLQQNDAFILDRGFRDSLDAIETCGYECYMPPSKDSQESQLTTEQANESRAVTVCRWVVEVVNGRFKRDYKLLRQKYFNRALPHMFVDYQIAASLINTFHTPIVDSVHSEEFWIRIRETVDLQNILYTYVERKRLNNGRPDFQRLEANNIENFPRLTENQIIVLALGTYQLKLARSYCGEHLQNGLYLIETYRENQLDDLPDYGIHEDVWLLRGRIQSRHVRARLYYCYILINSNCIEGRNNIVQHYCTCLSGRRTMGTCAHIISIIWYLGYAVHEGFTAPAMLLNDVILDNDRH